MSAFNIRKQSPNQGDKKSPSVAIKSRQQATHDINKRRTLLQDNSWIKKRPEEESADENYGRAVLNQYKSQDGLHSSSTNEKEDQKAVLGRYRSDTTLDRIPAGSDTVKINKSPTLNHKQNNRQSWTPNAASTTTTVISPVKKKRQSWMPPPVSSSKTLTEKVESKRTTSENSEAPTTAAPSSEQVTPQKSGTDVDDKATARNQDLNNLSKVIPSSSTSDKEGKDLSDLADQKNKRDEHLGDHTEVKSADGQSKKWIIEKAYENPPRAQNNLPEIKYSSDNERKTSKSSLGAYEKNITGNTIKTVYSTSDRFLSQAAAYSAKFPSFVKMVMTKFMYKRGGIGSRDSGELLKTIFSHQQDIPKYKQDICSICNNLPHGEKEVKSAHNFQFRLDYYLEIPNQKNLSIIGKDICTYCRKPLGIDAKMILDALQIHCHSTCFKCEVCKRPLEDLKAGDSIWIYKQTVHCEPCYSKVKEKWIY